MTWAFDNGLTLPLRTLVRNDVISRLAPLLKPTGFLEAVIDVGFGIKGANDDHGIDMLHKELMNRAPAIAVATTMSKHDPAGSPDRSRARLTVELYFVSTHLRGLTDGRMKQDPIATPSNTADPGIDATMQLAWQLLFDSEFSMPGTIAGRRRAQPMKMTDEEELITAEGGTIWCQRWMTEVTYDVNLWRAISQQFITARTRLFQTPDLLAYLKFASYTTHVNTIVTAKATRGDLITIQTIPRLTGLAPWVTYAENVGAKTITLTYERGIATVADLELALVPSTLVSVSTPGTPGNVMADPADTMAATHLTVPKSTITEDTAVQT